MIHERLEAVRDVYAVWGRHPLLYAAQDWITFVGRPRAIRRRAVEALALRPGARVLEVACGTGRNFDYLERAIGPTGSLVGFDFSREMLEAARGLVTRRGWRNVELVQGDAAVLDVGSAPFDGVLCVLGISAIPDHRRALERCRAVLRPGGVLVVCDGRAFTGLRGARSAMSSATCAVCSVTSRSTSSMRGRCSSPRRPTPRCDQSSYGVIEAITHRRIWRHDVSSERSRLRRGFDAAG